MHITILALGSRGDVQPYTALGHGLTQAGHSVRFATFENFRHLVEAQGLAFHPVKGDVQQLLNATAGMNLTGSGGNMLTMLRGIQQTFGQLTDDYIESFSSPALRDTDLILNQLPGALFGYDLAEALRVPHIVASVIPLVPTRAFPLSLLTPRSLGGSLNRLSYTIGQQAAWGMFRSGVQRFRKILGLHPAPFLGYPDQVWGHSSPVINGFSSQIVPRPADWNEHVHITGYWHLDEPNWQPAPALTRFLASGTPPVFVGFGSMPMRDPAATGKIVLEALQKSGQRGILARGWAQMSHDVLPATIFPVDYVPYPWLFPHMAAVVHHGGSGTTGMGAWAGVPSIIVPFGADQPYWGKRLADLGVGTAPVPYQHLTAEKLASAIQQTTDKTIREKAATLGEKLRQEDGIACAIDLIERYARRWKTQPKAW